VGSIDHWKSPDLFLREERRASHRHHQHALKASWTLAGFALGQKFGLRMR